MRDMRFGGILGLSVLASQAVLVLVLAGCSNEVPPYTTGRAEAYAPPQVMFAGPEAKDLRESTAVDVPMLSRDEAGLLFVNLPMRATGREILHTQYRVTFFDKNGQVMPGSPSGWLRKDLEPGSHEFVKFNSTSAQASDFQFEVRYAR